MDLATLQLDPRLSNIEASLDGILSAMGIAINTPTKKLERGVKPDRVLPEVALYSEKLGIATTTDGIVQHDNGEMSIFDIKTGDIVKDVNEPIMMNYGAQFNLNDSKLNRGKLEVVFRALLLKEQFPNMKFRNLQIVKLDYKGNPVVYNIEIKPFLGAIAAYYKETKPQVYEELNKKGLFTAQSYLGVSSSILDVYDEIKGIDNVNDQLIYLSNEINKVTLNEDEAGADKTYNKIRRAELTEAYLQLTKNKGEDFAKSPADLTRVGYWFKNLSDVEEPRVKALHKVLLEANEAKRKEAAALEKKHRELALAAVGDVYKGNKIVKNILTGVAGAAAALIIHPMLLPGVYIAAYIADRYGATYSQT